MTLGAWLHGLGSFMIPVKSKVRPALTRLLDNKLRVVPTYEEVPEGTALSDLSWQPPAAAVTPRLTQSRAVKVTGSRGTVYTVILWSDGTKECSCAGFKFRRVCKHLAQAK